MAAVMRIDQVGLPTGTNGRARDDGLDNGAQVTLTSTAHVSTFQFRLLWVGQHPEPDTTSVATLTKSGDNTYTFTPTEGVYGSWRIELITDQGTEHEDRQVRIFAIKQSENAVRIPAMNERSDPAASLVNNGADYINASEFNAGDGITNSPQEVASFNSYWREYADIIYQVNELKKLIDDLEGGAGGGVPTDREISTESPLQGGGTLDDDLTLSILAASSENAGSMSAEHWIKLEGIEDGATKNDTDENLRDRSTHTGTQAIETIDGLEEALDGKVSTTRTISTTSPLTGGGNLSANRTIAISSGSSAGQTLRWSGSAWEISLLDVEDIDGLEEELEGKAASEHTHSITDVINLQNALDGKVDTTRSISTSSPLTGGGNLSTNRTIAISSGSAAGQTLRWSGSAWDISLLGVEDVDGLGEALDGKASSTHTHTDLTPTSRTISTTSPLVGGGNLSANRTIAIDDGENEGETLRWDGEGWTIDVLDVDDIDGLNEALGGKADSEHTHAISDVTDLEGELAGKADASHTHAISDVTDLSTTLSGKVDTTRTISTTSPLTGGGNLSANRTIAISSGSSAGQTLRWSGSAWAISALGISDITNLSTTLSGKVDTTRTISTTAPLQGGGNLSENRTLSIDAASSSNAGTQSADHYAVTEALRRGFPDDAVYELTNSKTLGLTDLGRIVFMLANTPSSVIVPSWSVVNWPTKCPIVVIKSETVDTEVVGADGSVIIYPAKGYKPVIKKGGWAVLVQSSANFWDIFGDLKKDVAEGIVEIDDVTATLTTDEVGFHVLWSANPLQLLPENGSFVFEGVVIARIDGEFGSEFDEADSLVYKFIEPVYTNPDGSFELGFNSGNMLTTALGWMNDSPNTLGFGPEPLFDIKDGVLSLVVGHATNKDGVNIYWSAELKIRGYTKVLADYS